MKITFVLSAIGLSGGTKVVFEYANRLCHRGHKVSVVYPLVPLLVNLKWYNIVGWSCKLKSFIRNLTQGKKLIWFDLKAKLLRVPTLSERYIPDSDIVVATWWSTAFNVAGYDKSKGEKFYLVQHYEIWGGPKEKVDLSYKLGLKIVSVSNWVKNIIENELDGNVEAVIHNAPSWKQFYPENRTENNILRILTPYRKEKWKGFDDAVQAFRRAKHICPDLKLVAFGPCPNGNVDCKGLSQMMVFTTAFGYMSMTVKDMLKLQTPRPINEIDTWSAAFTQGGGAGIYGDFLFGEYNRFGRGVIETIGGPAIGESADLIKLAFAARQGDFSAAKTLRFIVNNTPFANLHMTRTAIDYAFLYNLQEWANPGYLKRREKNLAARNGQRMIFPISGGIKGVR